MPAANKLTLNILCSVLYQLKCYVSFWMFHLLVSFICDAIVAILSFPFFQICSVLFFSLLPFIDICFLHKYTSSIKRNKVSMHEEYLLNMLTENINLAPSSEMWGEKCTEKKSLQISIGCTYKSEIYMLNFVKHSNIWTNVLDVRNKKKKLYTKHFSQYILW